MRRNVNFNPTGTFASRSDKGSFEISEHGEFYPRHAYRDPIRPNTFERGYTTADNNDPANFITDKDFADARRSNKYEKLMHGIDHKISEDSATNRNTRINAGEFDCLQFIKNCLGIRGGRRGGGDGDSITLQDIRIFLDSHLDIKDMLMKQECPLNPSETMKSDIKELMDMMEKYGPVTINELYPKGGRKRRSRRTKRRKGKSRRGYSKRRYQV